MWRQRATATPRLQLHLHDSPRRSRRPARGLRRDRGRNRCSRWHARRHRSCYRARRAYSAKTRQNFNCIRLANGDRLKSLSRSELLVGFGKLWRDLVHPFCSIVYQSGFKMCRPRRTSHEREYRPISKGSSPKSFDGRDGLRSFHHDGQREDDRHGTGITGATH